MGLRKTKALPSKRRGMELPDHPSDTALEAREYYNDRFEEIDKNHKSTFRYAESTEESIARMEGVWGKYCEVVGIDPHETIIQAVEGRFKNFLHWMCNTYTVKKISSVETYWHTVSQLYIKWKGRRMDPVVLNHLYDFINGSLAEEHDLDDSETEKPLLDVEDFWEVLQCHWVTDTNKFPGERQRLQLATVLLFAAYTTSRPGALLGIKYGDVKLFVQQDSKTGATGLMLQVQLRKTKSRKKQARPKTYSFTLDDNPFFCVPSHFIALAQDDDAFDKLPDGSAVTTERILRMGVRQGLKSQPIPFRSELGDVPVFRTHVRTDDGVETSDHTALTYTKLNEWLKRLGTETGFVQVLTAYCLRRASGNAINDDPNASEPVRNLAMDHTNSSIFQRNYLSRMIRYDIQAAFRGTEPKTELIRAAGRMSRLMDTRRPKKLTDNQKNGILSEPALQQCRSNQERLFQSIRDEYKFVYKAKGEPIHDEYQRSRLDTYGAIRSRERAVLWEAQRKYDATVPLQDMQEQINGNTESIDAKLATDVIQYSFPERFRIAKAFLDSKSGVDCKLAARVALVNDLTLLCSRHETRLRARRRKLPLPPSKVKTGTESVDSGSEVEIGPPAAKRVHTGTDLEDRSIPVACERFQCLICLGRTRFSMLDRLHNYGSRDSLKRHFHRIHKTFECDSLCPHPNPHCAKIVLTSGMHFLNHAATVHGIVMDAKTWSAAR